MSTSGSQGPIGSQSGSVILAPKLDQHLRVGAMKRESETEHEPGYASCWVPSKAGAPFRIGYSAREWEFGLKVSVYIDGELVAEQTHAPARRGRNMLCDGIRARKGDFGMERPFLFKERTITDDDLDVIPESRLPQLGSIKVRFSWIVVDHSSLSARPCTQFRPPSSHHQSVYEGLVKRRSSAVAHAAGLGAIRKITPNWISEKYRVSHNRSTLRPLRWRETGLRSTMFEFKYAPAEYLSSENILQCSLALSQSLETPESNRVGHHSPWRSHVGTPYRELRANASFTGLAHTRTNTAPRNFWFSSDSGLDFNTPVKLGTHTVTNYTPLAKLGTHTITDPIKMSPLVKVAALVKDEPEVGDASVVEISAGEFYRREVIDLTGLDSDED